MCDVSSDEQIAKVFEELKGKYGTLQGIVHSVAFAPAEELKGTGYLTPPPFVTLPMVKQVARGLSIFLVFSWGFASTSATTQRQFLKDVETRLLGRSKDGQERNLT